MYNPLGKRITLEEHASSSSGTDGEKMRQLMKSFQSETLRLNANIERSMMASCIIENDQKFMGEEVPLDAARLPRSRSRGTHSSCTPQRKHTSTKRLSSGHAHWKRSSEGERKWDESGKKIMQNRDELILNSRQTVTTTEIRPQTARGRLETKQSESDKEEKESREKVERKGNAEKKVSNLSPSSPANTQSVKRVVRRPTTSRPTGGIPRPSTALGRTLLSQRQLRHALQDEPDSVKAGTLSATAVVPPAAESWFKTRGRGDSKEGMKGHNSSHAKWDRVRYKFNSTPDVSVSGGSESSRSKTNAVSSKSDELKKEGSEVSLWDKLRAPAKNVSSWFENAKPVEPEELPALDVPELRPHSIADLNQLKYDCKSPIQQISSLVRKVLAGTGAVSAFQSGVAASSLPSHDNSSGTEESSMNSNGEDEEEESNGEKDANRPISTSSSFVEAFRTPLPPSEEPLPPEDAEEMDELELKWMDDSEVKNILRLSDWKPLPMESDQEEEETGRRSSNASNSGGKVDRDTNGNRTNSSRARKSRASTPHLNFSARNRGSVGSSEGGDCDENQESDMNPEVFELLYGGNVSSEVRHAELRRYENILPPITFDVNIMARTLTEASSYIRNCYIDLSGPMGPTRSTLLHTAAWFRRFHPIRLLLQSGADPNVANLKGNTPLHLICEQAEAGKEFAVPCLLVMILYSGNVDVQNIAGQTPRSIFQGCDALVDLAEKINVQIGIEKVEREEQLLASGRGKSLAESRNHWRNQVMRSAAVSNPSLVTKHMERAKQIVSSLEQICSPNNKYSTGSEYLHEGIPLEEPKEHGWGAKLEDEDDKNTRHRRTSKFASRKESTRSQSATVSRTGSDSVSKSKKKKRKSRKTSISNARTSSSMSSSTATIKNVVNVSKALNRLTRPTATSSAKTVVKTSVVPPSEVTMGVKSSASREETERMILTTKHVRNFPKWLWALSGFQESFDESLQIRALRILRTTSPLERSYSERKVLMSWIRDRGHAFLARQPELLLLEVMNLCRLRELKKGDLIYKEGDIAQNVYTLLDGECVVASKKDMSVMNHSLTSVKAPGTVFGHDILIQHDEKPKSLWNTVSKRFKNAKGARSLEEVASSKPSDKKEIDLSEIVKMALMKKRTKSAVAKTDCTVLVFDYYSFDALDFAFRKHLKNSSIRLLRQLEFCKMWSYPQLKRLASHLKILEYRKGDVIARQGATLNRVCFIKEGEVALYREVEVTRSQSIPVSRHTWKVEQTSYIRGFRVATKRVKDMFGEEAFIKYPRREYTVKCVSSKCVMLVLSHEWFHHFGIGPEMEVIMKKRVKEYSAFTSSILRSKLAAAYPESERRNPFPVHEWNPFGSPVFGLTYRHLQPGRVFVNFDPVLTNVGPVHAPAHSEDIHSTALGKRILTIPQAKSEKMIVNPDELPSRTNRALSSMGFPVIMEAPEGHKYDDDVPVLEGDTPGDSQPDGETRYKAIDSSIISSNIPFMVNESDDEGRRNSIFAEEAFVLVPSTEEKEEELEGDAVCNEGSYGPEGATLDNNEQLDDSSTLTDGRESCTKLRKDSRASNRKSSLFVPLGLRGSTGKLLVGALSDAQKNTAGSALPVRSEPCSSAAKLSRCVDQFEVNAVGSLGENLSVVISNTTDEVTDDFGDGETGELLSSVQVPGLCVPSSPKSRSASPHISAPSSPKPQKTSFLVTSHWKSNAEEKPARSMKAFAKRIQFANRFKKTKPNLGANFLIN